MRPRVLFYAVNGVGLGHLTRLLALCQALRAECPQLEPLFLTTSDADNLLTRYGIPYVHLPSKTAAGGTTLTYRRLGRLYSALVNPLYDQWQPHMLVVDTLVTGSLHDLLNILRFGNAFKVYVHRARKPDAYDQGTVQAQRFYDLVLTPHYRDSELIPMPVGFDVPLYWSGPLFFQDDTPADSREAIRARLGLAPSDQLLLLTLGGGGDPAIAALLQSLQPLLAQRPGLRVLFAQGPLARTAPPAWCQAIQDFPASSLLPAVDMAISAAGYNSFHELLHYGVPTLLLPQPRGYDDQLARAARAAAAGAALCVPPAADGQPDAHQLTQAVERLLSDAPLRSALAQAARSYVPVNHAREAARVLLSQLHARLFPVDAPGDEEA